MCDSLNFDSILNTCIIIFMTGIFFIRHQIKKTCLLFYFNTSAQQWFIRSSKSVPIHFEKRRHLFKTDSLITCLYLFFGVMGFSRKSPYPLVEDLLFYRHPTPGYPMFWTFSFSFLIYSYPYQKTHIKLSN